MNRFESLLKTGLGPRIEQEQARAKFPEEVGKSQLSLRCVTCPIPSAGTQLILGVATYSVPELQLLDEIDAALRGSDGGAPNIAVFAVDSCLRMEELDGYIPGVGPVYGTPVLGVVVDGHLSETVKGVLPVRDALRRFHVLNES